MKLFLLFSLLISSAFCATDAELVFDMMLKNSELTEVLRKRITPSSTIKDLVVTKGRIVLDPETLQRQSIDLFTGRMTSEGRRIPRDIRFEIKAVNLYNMFGNSTEYFNSLR